MAKNIFFKKIPRTLPGFRVILIQNKYYWIVPKYMDLFFNDATGYYGLRYKLLGKFHTKTTSSPSIEWFLETMKNMVSKLYGAGVLYRFNVSENINIVRHAAHPYHYFCTPTLACKLWNKPKLIITPYSRNQNEIDLFLSQLKEKRDALLTKLHSITRIVPDEAMTLYTEDPTDALVAKWKERYEQ